MHDHDQARRFVQSVDRLLADQPIDEPVDASEQADLALARRLSQVHYVPSPQFEARLRNRLLNRAPTKEATSMMLFRSWTRPLLLKGVVGGLLLGILLALSLAAAPGARATVQRWFAHFVEVDSPQAPGAPVVSPAADFDKSAPAVAPADKAAVPANPPALPNIPPADALTALEEAQANIGFTIRMPASLPDGYRFLGVVPTPVLPAGAPIPLPAGAPKIEPPQVAILIFRNAAGEELMLSQARMDALASTDTSLAAGKGSVQEVTVDQQPAQYIEGMWTANGWVANGNHQLHWQGADGVMYDLTSPTLGLKELLAVAESLK
jgi:hypothetical protein